MFEGKIGAHFEGFLEWSARTKKKNTIKEYRRMTNGPFQIVAGISVRKFRMADVALIRESAKDYGEYAEEKAMVVFRRFARYLKEIDHPLSIDWRDVQINRKKPKVVDFLDVSEIDRLREAINLRSENGIRTRAMFELMLHTGLRISEAISLCIRDINFERMEISVTNCKSGKKQVVYLTENAARWIRRYLDLRRDDCPYLFISSRVKNPTRPICTGTARAELTNCENKAGLSKPVYWHLLRKTFVTQLLFNGVDIKTTQHLARHESEGTTLRHYAAVNHANARADFERVMDRV